MSTEIEKTIEPIATEEVVVAVTKGVITSEQYAEITGEVL